MALKEIALKAIRKKTGARGLRSILENILLKTNNKIKKYKLFTTKVDESKNFQEYLRVFQ